MRFSHPQRFPCTQILVEYPPGVYVKGSLATKTESELLSPTTPTPSLMKTSLKRQKRPTSFLGTRLKKGWVSTDSADDSVVYDLVKTRLSESEAEAKG